MDIDSPASIFFNKFEENYARLKSGQRLVHYTSAESAYKIITSGIFWMRNALLMNDFSEISHGVRCLQAAWQSPTGVAFQKWIDGNWPELQNEFVDLFDGHMPSISASTYILSLSEHLDSEDNHGRLSMWRAYGGKTGVALVLKPDIFISESDQMSVYSHPIIYKDVDDFSKFLQDIFNAIMDRLKIDEFNKTEFINDLFLIFRIAALCVKHPGFEEEREWRVFHTPHLDGNSKWICNEVEVVNGIPQEIIKIHLKNDESKGVIGLSPDALLERIIIGPTQDFIPLKKAFHRALDSIGHASSRDCVFVSNIPIRT